MIIVESGDGRDTWISAVSHGDEARKSMVSQSGNFVHVAHEVDLDYPFWIVENKRGRIPFEFIGENGFLEKIKSLSPEGLEGNVVAYKITESFISRDGERRTKSLPNLHLNGDVLRSVREGNGIPGDHP